MAIAFVASSNVGVENQTGSSATFAVDAGSSANRILYCGVQITDNSRSVSGITYNGVALTKIAHKDTPNGSRRVELWYLLNPASGSNDVIVTLSGAPTNWFNAGVSVLERVQQSGQPEAFDSNAADSGATNVSQAVTTVQDNVWLIGVLNNGAAANPVANAGTTLRLSLYNRTGNGYEMFLMDSNGAKTPPGNYSLGVTSDSTGYAVIVASIMPDELTINVNDSVSISESVTMDLQSFINVNDSLTITELVSLRDPSRGLGISKMKSKGNEYPLAMDDKTIL